MSRPSASVLNIGKRVENVYADLEAAVGIGVNTAMYVENIPEAQTKPTIHLC